MKGIWSSKTCSDTHVWSMTLNSSIANKKWYRPVAKILFSVRQTWGRCPNRGRSLNQGHIDLRAKPEIRLEKESGGEARETFKKILSWNRANGDCGWNLDERPFFNSLKLLYQISWFKIVSESLSDLSFLFVLLFYDFFYLSFHKYCFISMC